MYHLCNIYVKLDFLSFYMMKCLDLSGGKYSHLNPMEWALYDLNVSVYMYSYIIIT